MPNHSAPESSRIADVTKSDASPSLVEKCRSAPVAGSSRSMPWRRAHIDPAAIVFDQAPHVVGRESLRRPERLKHRLVGIGIVDAREP